MIVLHTPPNAPAAEVAAHCPRNSRDCFPHDRVGVLTEDRGSGRGVETITYTVWVAGYETIKAANGEPISEAFVTDVVHLDVPSGGAFGWGEVQHINDWVEQHMPGYTVMDVQAERDTLVFAEF